MNGKTGTKHFAGGGRVDWKDAYLPLIIQEDKVAEWNGKQQNDFNDEWVVRIGYIIVAFTLDWNL